jgi:glycosyltransferase involved in cell wall biosynthesis
MTPLLRCLIVIPAHNEAQNLPAVIEEIRQNAPHMNLLVVDDGSTDETCQVLDALGVRWMRLPQRLGVGGAMRAGLRYARHLGFDTVARMDGDGQHHAAELGRLLDPIATGDADIVIGTRYADRQRGRGGVIRYGLRRVLAAGLSAVTGCRLTDPTSGYCAFGPRAVRLFSAHHPTGYAEPELLLLAHRNALQVREVPVACHDRIAGRTTLTGGRVVVAIGRVLLALLIVPLRGAVRAPAHD